MKEQSKKVLTDWLENEKQAFQGWDFSYLDGRWQFEGLPWCYKRLVKAQRLPELKLLDLDTGAVVCFVKIIE